nr:S49 family peptidase [Vibrio campbellii]
MASACDEIVIDATGCAGSIGTVLEMRVRKQRDEDEFETIEIVSSQSPNKRQDPSTETGRAAYQKHLDDLAEVFVQRVARNMAVSRDTVINEFGGGGILIGQDAVDKGMAHRLGSLEGVIAELKTGKKATMDPKKEETGASDDNKVVLTLPGSDAVSAADLVAAITEQRPDAIEAIKGPAPEMALAHASDIVQLCAKAGVPALSATLLKDGVTKASAENTITMAGALKDTLAASGLSGSYDALVGCIDEPVKMVGKAIHEAKAEADENGDQSRQITDEVKKTAKLNTTDIYAARN